MRTLVGGHEPQRLSERGDGVFGAFVGVEADAAQPV
jgi:hypothetical protein